MVENKRLGDILFIWENSNLEGFVVCYYGVGIEVGSDICYIKFGVVNLGKKGSDCFVKLLNECEIFSNIIGMFKFVVGVNIVC